MPGAGVFANAISGFGCKVSGCYRALSKLCNMENSNLEPVSDFGFKVSDCCRALSKLSIWKIRIPELEIGFGLLPCFEQTFNYGKFETRNPELEIDFLLPVQIERNCRSFILLIMDIDISS